MVEEKVPNEDGGITVVAVATSVPIIVLIVILTISVIALKKYQKTNTSPLR